MEMYRHGAVEDMAQKMVDQVNPSQETRQQVEDEILNLIIAEQSAGNLDPEALLERIVETLAPKSKAEQRALLQSVMAKGNRAENEGIGRSLDLQ